MFKKQVNRRSLAAGAVLSVAAAKTGSVVAAQDATPQSSPASNGVSTEVLASGLADPRFVVVDGSDVFFTESGTGGEEGLILPSGEGTPEATEPISMFGYTGKVSKLAADGTITEIKSDIVSYTFGANGEIVGAAGLALDGSGSVYVTVGAPGPYIADMPRTGDEGVVLKIDIETGESSVVADLLQWELDENPDPHHFDSNLYGASLVDGVLYVADSGGNDVVAVDVESGAVSTFAVTAGLPADFMAETGNPNRNGEAEIDSVPSSVTPGPDGRLYVSYITGGPFPAGYAPVDAYSLDGKAERVVEGLTMTSDIAFDSTGRMYASIVSTDMINGGPGQVWRVEEDGSFTVVVDGLALPAGITFDADDNLYVVNKSSMVPGGGEILKVTGVVDVPAGTGSGATEVPDEATPVDTASSDAHTFHLELVDTAYEPSELTIPANVDVTITLENTGFLAHDFVLENPKIVSDVLGNGDTTSVVLNLEPGTYIFYCSQIGHRQMGMEGTLTVE